MPEDFRLSHGFLIMSARLFYKNWYDETWYNSITQELHFIYTWV